IDASRDFRNPRDTEKFAHLIGILRRYRHDMAGRAAGTLLVFIHQLRLPLQIHPAQRIARMLDMPAPDDGLHIVLKEQAAIRIWKIRGGWKKIDHGPVEALFAD